MANTYTQLLTHLVFAVKNREALIKPAFREEVEKYMTSVLQNKGHKLLAIYLMPDHAHILIGLNPSISLSETVKILKTQTTEFIHARKFIPYKFQWQAGYGAFSHTKRDLHKVVQYILNQPIHHQQKSFREEYLAILKRSEIEFDEAYLFDFF